MSDCYLLTVLPVFANRLLFHYVLACGKPVLIQNGQPIIVCCGI